MTLHEARMRCIELAARSHPGDPCGYAARALADELMDYVYPPMPPEAPAPATRAELNAEDLF